VEFTVKTPAGASPQFIMGQAVDGLVERRKDLERRQNCLLDELTAVRLEHAEVTGALTKAREAVRDLERLHEERANVERASYVAATPSPTFAPVYCTCPAGNVLCGKCSPKAAQSDRPVVPPGPF
jgi:hypothetical protein